MVPGFDADSKIILWGGGVYNWFDPISLIHAVDRLRHRLPEVRLFFLGMKHPNPHVPEMRMAVRTKQLADDLGLTDTHVFFNEGWVEYEDRQNYLLEADLGVSTHLDHVETEFSFRTRILDYLWAGLPVVATGGDSFAEIIKERGIGSTVPAEDVDALEAALFAVLSDPEPPPPAGGAGAGRRVPLVEPARAARRVLPRSRRAPDLVSPDQAELIGVGRSQVTRPLKMVHFREDVRTIGAHVKNGEMGLMIKKAGGREARRHQDLVEGAMTAADAPSEGPRCRVLLRVSGDERRFLDVAAALARLAPACRTISASDGALLDAFDGSLASLAVHPSAHAAANELLALGVPVLVVTDVVALPDDIVDRAVEFLDADLRNATVSFSSNDAGPLSFPTNHPTVVPPPGFDHRTLTARLRSCTPPLGVCPAPSRPVRPS